MILRKGEPVKVRLNSGAVVTAKYICMYHQGEHEVEYGGTLYCATDKFYDKSCVRFVGNPCVILRDGVQA